MIAILDYILKLLLKMFPHISFWKNQVLIYPLRNVPISILFLYHHPYQEFHCQCPKNQLWLNHYYSFLVLPYIGSMKDGE